MFSISEIRELIKLLDSTNITELEVEHEGTKLSIKKGKSSVDERIQFASNPVTAPSVLNQSVTGTSIETVTEKQVIAPASTNVSVVAKEEVNKNIVEIKSPMVGTFYASPSPDSPAYVKVGDKVTEKTIVCIVEAMKLMNEIESECNGKIIEVCVENGQLVEYGQTLFKVSVE